MSAHAVTTHRPPAPLSGTAPGRLLRLVPGLVLTAGIAGTATWLHGFATQRLVSPLILAIVIGMVLHNSFALPAAIRPGITFSLKRLLRLAIILLGAQLTVGQVAAIGGAGILIIVATLVASFIFTMWLGRALGVDAKLAQLIGAGTSICGASAVIATNTVTDGSDEDVAYAVAVVTVFGSLSMLLYPMLSGLLGLEPRAFGLWAGASIHEIAQVVAAAFQGGPEAGDFGMISKLSRVTLLAPVVVALGLTAARRRTQGALNLRRVPIPWFVLGFVAMIGVNSMGLLPASLKEALAGATQILLAMALAAMGLETNVRKLVGKGIAPLLLGGGAWLFISLFSLIAIFCLY